jgi:cyclopropane fatty-acyl-phospholipid synthase-like methyltransferase
MKSKLFLIDLISYSLGEFMTKIYDPTNFPSKMALTVKKYLRDIVAHNKINFLDIGCGEGRDVLYLEQYLKNRRIIAIDPSRAALQKARETLPDESDIEFRAIGFKDIKEKEQFDVIVVSNVYHFFRKGQRKLFKEKIKKIMKPKGYFFLSTLSSNDTQYYGKGTQIPNDPNSFKGITYLHFASKSELIKEFNFLRIIELNEYYQKNFSTDMDYHTMWMLVCKCS